MTDMSVLKLADLRTVAIFLFGEEPENEASDGSRVPRH